MGLFVIFSSLLALASQVGTLFDSAMRYLLNLLFLGGTTIVFGINRNKISWQQLGLHFSRWRWRFLWTAILLSLAINPIRALIALAAQQFIGGGLAALEGRAEIILAGGFTWPAFLLTLLGVGIFIPLAEEMYFRGLLHNWFAERFRFWPRVLLSSMIFGLGHFDTLGVLISSFIMGIVIAIAYERTKTLWLPVAIHAVTNGGSIILLYLAMALRL
ncbi:MAG: type II CAAX endopeptidase family protein [Anaerolineaceae bacterium]|jgi:membrane protease YdiL (CAAX protease family)